jgi:hypothetical protein
MHSVRPTRSAAKRAAGPYHIQRHRRSVAVPPARPPRPPLPE